MPKELPPLWAASLTVRNAGRLSDDEREALAHWLRYEAQMLKHRPENYYDTVDYHTTAHLEGDEPQKGEVRIQIQGEVH